MHTLKKNISLFCVYKMVDISANTFAENCIHTISIGYCMSNNWLLTRLSILERSLPTNCR